MQPPSSIASPRISNGPEAVGSTEESISDDDQAEDDNIRNLHFSSVPIVTTERCIGPSELIGHSITLFDSTFYVIGGKLPSEEKYFNDVYMLDMHGESFIWSKPKVRGDSLPPLSSHVAIPFSKKIFIFGGKTAHKISNDVFSFSVSTLSWTQCRPYGDRPAARYGHSANVISKKAFVVFGGKGEEVYNDVHVFDMTDMSWERKSTKNAPSPRYAHAAVYHNSQLYVYGGSTTKGVVFNDLFILSTRDWTWKQIVINHSSPLYYHTLSLLSHHLVIVGGVRADSRSSSSVSAVDLTTNEWVPIDTLKREKFPPLYGHASSVLKNRFVILLGGASNSKEKEFGIRILSPIKISMSSKAKAVIAKKEIEVNPALAEQIRKNLTEMRRLVQQKLESLGAPPDAEFERQLDACEKRIECVVNLPKLRLNGHVTKGSRSNSVDKHNDPSPKSPTQNGNGSSTPSSSQNAGADNRLSVSQDQLKRSPSDKTLINKTETVPNVHRRLRSASMNASAIAPNRLSLVPLPPRDAAAAEEVIKTNHQRAMKEICEGEVQFLADLNITRRVFMTPLQAMLSAADVQVIFSNLNQVIGVCQELVVKLEEVIKKPPEQQNIGEVFLEMMPYLKVFLEFCSNHGEARSTVENLKNKNPQFAKFLDDCLRNPECRLMEFESFLIKPMQRITRYPLLFRELLKYTSPTHTDYFYLVKAQQELQNLVQEANERKRSLENAARVAQIQRKMVWSGPKIMLLTQNRELLYEGVFCAAVTKNFEGPVKVDLNRKLRILVFTDTLFVVKNKRSLGNEKYVEKCRMPLHLCLIWPVSPDDFELKNSTDYGEDAIVHGFSIVIPDTIRVVVCAGTEAEKEECMRMLGESVGKCGSFFMRQTHREKEKFRRSRSTNDLTKLTLQMKPTLIPKVSQMLTPRSATTTSPSSSPPVISLVPPPAHATPTAPSMEPPTPTPIKTTPQRLSTDKLEKPQTEKGLEKTSGEKLATERTPAENGAVSKPISIVRTTSTARGGNNRNARVFFNNSPTVTIPDDHHVSSSIAQPSPSSPPSVLSPTFPTLGSSATLQRSSPPTLQVPTGRLSGTGLRNSPTPTPPSPIDTPPFPEYPKLSDSPRMNETPRVNEALRLSTSANSERRRPVDISRRFSDSPRPKPIIERLDVPPVETPSADTPQGPESPRNSESPNSNFAGGPQLAESPREKKSALRRATSMFNKKKKKEG